MFTYKLTKLGRVYTYTERGVQICSATRKGLPCYKFPVNGSTFCKIHGSMVKKGYKHVKESTL